MIPLNFAYNKNKLSITLDCWSRDKLNFDILEKGLRIVPPPHYVYDFSIKCFSCYILLTDQISWYNCPYILRYLVICVLQLFVSQVVTSYIFKDSLNASLVLKPMIHVTYIFVEYQTGAIVDHSFEAIVWPY